MAWLATIKELGKKMGFGWLLAIAWWLLEVLLRHETSDCAVQPVSGLPSDVIVKKAIREVRATRADRRAEADATKLRTMIM
jgi:hypothetical protein